MRSPVSNAWGKSELNGSAIRLNKKKTFVKPTDFLIKRYKIQALYQFGIYITKSPQDKVRTGDQI